MLNRMEKTAVFCTLEKLRKTTEILVRITDLKFEINT